MNPAAPAATFGCEVVELPDEVLITVTGEVDLRLTDEFRRCLGDATRPGKPLFIDLTAVSFIDGRGYRAIRAAASWLPRPDVTVTVAAGSELAAAILQAIGGTAIRIQMT
ncbi:MAG TPA: STAS domain-containing protein [Streptosporangiaceae bacterium]